MLTVCCTVENDDCNVYIRVFNKSLKYWGLLSGKSRKCRKHIDFGKRFTLKV